MTGGGGVKNGVKIVAGIHKGKRGNLTGMFWGADIATVSVCGEEVYVGIDEVAAEETEDTYE